MWGRAAKVSMPMQWVSIIIEEPQIRKLQFFLKGFKKTCSVFALEGDLYKIFEMAIYPEVNLKVNFQMFKLDIEKPEET